MGKLVFLLAVCGVLHVSAQIRKSVNFEYDCGRSSMECENNSTCPDDGGLCVCDDSLTGPDCSLKTSSTSRRCNPPCENGGTCFTNDENNSGVCLCPSLFAGISCAQMRVSSECNHDHIYARLAPPVGVEDNFEGVIYVIGYEGEDNCTFSPAGDGFFDLALYFTECGGAKNFTESNGDETLFFTVIVRYDPLLTTETDVEFDFNCRIAQSGGNVTWNLSPMVSSEKDDRNLQRKEVTGELVPVELQLLDKDLMPLQGEQELGDKVTLIYTLNAGAVYDSFRLQDLVVSNGLAGKKRRAVPFIIDGCVTDDAYKRKKIVLDFNGNPAEQIKLTFKVFKLPFNNELNFENTVKLCKGAADCNATNCAEPSSPFNKFGRRRRSAELFEVNESIDLEVLDTKLQVVYPGRLEHFQTEDELVLQEDPTTVSEDCIQLPAVLMALGISGLVIVILLATIVFLCVRSFGNTYQNDSPNMLDSKFTKI